MVEELTRLASSALGTAAFGRATCAAFASCSRSPLRRPLEAVGEAIREGRISSTSSTSSRRTRSRSSPRRKPSSLAPRAFGRARARAGHHPRHVLPPPDQQVRTDHAELFELVAAAKAAAPKTTSLFAWSGRPRTASGTSSTHNGTSWTSRFSSQRPRAGQLLRRCSPRPRLPDAATASSGGGRSSSFSTASSTSPRSSTSSSCWRRSSARTASPGEPNRRSVYRPERLHAPSGGGRRRRGRCPGRTLHRGCRGGRERDGRPAREGARRRGDDALRRFGLGDSRCDRRARPRPGQGPPRGSSRNQLGTDGAPGR